MNAKSNRKKRKVEGGTSEPVDMDTTMSTGTVVDEQDTIADIKESSLGDQKCQDEPLVTFSTDRPIPIEHFRFSEHVDAGSVSGTADVALIQLYLRGTGRSPSVTLTGGGIVPRYAFDTQTLYAKENDKPSPTVVVNVGNDDCKTLDMQQLGLHEFVTKFLAQWQQEQSSIPSVLVDRTACPLYSVSKKPKADGTMWPNNFKSKITPTTRFCNSEGILSGGADALNRAWTSMDVSFPFIYITKSGEYGLVKNMLQLNVGNVVESSSQAKTIPAVQFNVDEHVQFLSPETADMRTKVGIRSKDNVSQYIHILFDQGGNFPPFAVQDALMADTKKIAFHCTPQEYDNLIVARDCINQHIVTNKDTWVQGTACTEVVQGKISAFIPSRKPKKTDETSFHSPIFSASFKHDSKTDPMLCCDLNNNPVPIEELKNYRYKSIEVLLSLVHSNRMSIGVSKKIKKIIVYPL
jgi:hypothetical protein